MRTLILLTTLWGIIAWEDATPTTNGKIVQFCKDHLGKKVGGGECTHLAEAALRHAGAKPRTAFKDCPNRGAYVWGKLVYALEIKEDSQKEMKVPRMSIQPGDLIQLRDARFKGSNLLGHRYEMTYPHHTSIVSALRENNVIAVLEQNVNGERQVMESTYHLTHLKTGWLRVYRPVSE
jgi:hypothetical protein